MPAEKLQHAVDAIHVRFGGHALVAASRLPAAAPWPTGLPAVDRLSGIGGMPRGRVSVVQGRLGSGKLSLALALLARATHEHARTVVIDRAGEFDPWVPDRLGAALGALTVVRPRTPAVAGEAAVALARAGAGFALLLEAPPEPALAPLESAAARSDCLVVVVPGGGDERRALAHASSLTLEMEWLAPLREGRLLAGVGGRGRGGENKLAAPGAEAELEMRYPLAPGLPAAEAPREVERFGAGREREVEPWPGASAAG